MPLADIADRVERRLWRALEALRTRLTAILARIAEVDGAVARDAQTVADLSRAIDLLRSEMRAGGLDGALAELQREVEQLVQETIAEVAEEAGLPESLAGPTRQMVRALTGRAVEQVASIMGKGASMMEEYLAAAMIGGVRRSDLLLMIQDTMAITVQQVQTAAATAIHALHRQVTVAHAQDAGVTEFAYVGPADSVTREWCSHWVGRRATAEEYEATAAQWERERQPVPVMVFGGGWNCRHRFVPVVGAQARERYERGPR